MTVPAILIIVVTFLMLSTTDKSCPCYVIAGLSDNPQVLGAKTQLVGCLGPLNHGKVTSTRRKLTTVHHTLYSTSAALVL